MGNVEARFHQLLLSGEHEQALHFWSENQDFQSKLDLKTPVRGSQSKDSPLHCLLRVGNYRQPFLKILMHEFIEKGADPLFRNGSFETSIHVVCCSQRHSARENKARREILELLLDELPSIDSQPTDSVDVRDVPAKGGVSRNIATHLNIGDKVHEHICTHTNDVLLGGLCDSSGNTCTCKMYMYVLYTHNFTYQLGL